MACHNFILLSVHVEDTWATHRRQSQCCFASSQNMPVSFKTCLTVSIQFLLGLPGLRSVVFVSLCMICFGHQQDVLEPSQSVTVTEALVLRPLLEDRGCVIESIRILVPVDRMKQKCFQITMKRVRRSQQFQLLFHARSAATEKALSPIRRRVCGTTRLPHDESCSVDQPGILATDVRR